MRALLDTNIFISHLLDPERESRANRVLEVAVRGKFVLLLPAELISEMRSKIPRTRYLADRISPTQVEELADILTEIAEGIPPITAEIPEVTRDPKDDYLIAYAVIGQADYLVSGDRDLQVLKQVEGVQIVDLGRFEEILNELDRTSSS
jgi:putative PIN family toxin of toxin-antitoxin system